VYGKLENNSVTGSVQAAEWRQPPNRYRYRCH